MAGALAGRQYGVVSRAQLTALGVSRGAIERRLAAGRFLRLHRGVYAVGHRAPRREARWLAAVLAGGEGAVLSHRSAAALWGLVDDDGPRTDVTSARMPRHPGIDGHVVVLEHGEVTVRLAIPVTTPARTLVDLARVVDRGTLLRAVREAQFRGLFRVHSVRAALLRRPSRDLRALVDDLAPTQSVLEDHMLAICDRNRIPRPETQQWLGGRRVDFVWRNERVVVETDGWQGHSTQDAFQADRTMSNELQLAGYAVLRFTYADVTRRPGRVATAVRTALCCRTPPSG